MEWARALLMAARIHDGDDIRNRILRFAVQSRRRPTTALQRKGDIGALVIRRRKRETMRATMAAPNG